METKKQLKERIRLLQEELETCENELLNNISKNFDIKKENKELEDKLRLLEKEIELKHLDLSSLEKTNKELQENLISVGLENRNLRTLVENREVENDNLKKELSKEKDTRNDYFDALTNALCKIVKLTNELEKVSKKPKKED